MSKKKKKKATPVERVRINFGNRTRYKREKDDVPVADRGRAYQFSDGEPADYDPGYEDDLLADGPDIGDR